jgi:hypothetical protein
MTVAEFFSIYLNHNLIKPISLIKLIVGSSLTTKLDTEFLKLQKNVTDIKNIFI